MTRSDGPTRNAGRRSTRNTAWAGVALRRVRLGADPDAPPRAVALPAAWDDEAAAALVALAPGEGPVSLPSLAEGWIRPLAARGRKLGLLPDAGSAEGLAAGLRALLLARRGAPGAGTWANDPEAGDPEAGPRFVLNLPAFLDGEGFDAAGYAAAVRLGVTTLEILGNARASRLSLGFADLAGLLAGLGLDYDSGPARDVAAALAALTRATAEAASGELAESLGERFPVVLAWPAPPANLPVPGLAEAARAALDAAAGAPGLRHAALLVLSPPDAAEALLGAETGGLAPAAAPGRLAEGPDGALVEVPTRAALRAGAEAARLLAPRGPEARAAMEAALRPWLHAPAPAAVASVRPPRPAPKPRAAPPAHGRGAVWKVTVGGHRVTLRTMEGAEGLEEVSLALAKDGAAFRGVVEALCHAVTIGLSAGVRLDEYVQAFAYTRFGPAGAVEGDPAIHRASSLLDWAFRRLALDHLGGRVLPDPSEEECGADHPGSAAQQLPLLPDLPAAPAPASRRRALKLVG